MNTENAASPSIDEQLSTMAEMLTVQNDRLRKLENTLTICQQRVVALAGREPNYTDPDASYMSALTFCETKTDMVSHIRAAHALDELALEMCRKLCIRIGREPNAIWGWAYLYPLAVLHECYLIMNQE
ncbi:MAG: hypothetical protein H7838_07685 [Magnetococcus sp. DMHC-8]